MMNMGMLFWKKKIDLFSKANKTMMRNTDIYGFPESEGVNEGCSTGILRKMERKAEENHNGQRRTKTLGGI